MNRFFYSIDKTRRSELRDALANERDIILLPNDCYKVYAEEIYVTLKSYNRCLGVIVQVPDEIPSDLMKLLEEFNVKVEVPREEKSFTKTVFVHGGPEEGNGA